MKLKKIGAFLLLSVGTIAVGATSNPAASAFANFTFYNKMNSTLTITFMWSRCSTPNLPKSLNISANKSQSISFDKSCSFSFSGKSGTRSFSNQSSKNKTAAYVYLPSYVGAQDTGSNLVVLDKAFKS